MGLLSRGGIKERRREREWYVYCTLPNTTSVGPEWYLESAHRSFCREMSDSHAKWINQL